MSNERKKYRDIGIIKSKINIDSAEKQITEKRKKVDYDTRDFTIEHIVMKFLTKIDSGENEIFIPEYQREFIWDKYKQSRFIESILLGLPIPVLFLYTEKDTARLEVIDGSQRIRTLADFMENNLDLIGLENLTEFNGFFYDDLPILRKRLFYNTPMRILILTEKADENVRNELFDRINTSSEPLVPMETRRGIIKGEYLDLISKLANDRVFKEITPVDRRLEKRYEREELLLRFFSLCESFPSMRFHGKSIKDLHGINKFLDHFLNYNNQHFDEQLRVKTVGSFHELIDFVKTNFKLGFRKAKRVKGVSRPYFEALSVGVYLALQENKNIENLSVRIEKFYTDVNDRNSELNKYVSTRTQTHNEFNVRKRIQIVKDIFIK